MRLARLVTLACALAAMLALSLHAMAPAGATAVPLAHAAHGMADPGGQPDDPDGSAACAVHCLAAGVLPAAEAAPAPTPRPSAAPDPRARLAGLAPPPPGPPPKPVASA